MMHETHRTQVLARYPVLHSLPARLRDKLQFEAMCVNLAAGQVLFDLEQACHAVLLLLTGAIRVVKPTPTGREILLYRLEPGDSCIVTVACLLGRSPYTARGVVDIDALGVVVPEPLFTQLLTESDAFRQYVFRFFAERVAELMQRVEEVAFRPLTERLAVALLSKPQPIDITHQRLADELGSVREVISRILKEFEAQGLVRLERGRIWVLEPHGLGKVAAPLSDSDH